MKTAMTTLGLFLAGLFAAGVALGADEMKMKERVGAMTTLHSAQEFIGTEVRDSNGEKVGKIEDMAFDFEHGIGYAVVAAEGQEENLLVPLSGLTADHEGEYVVLSVDRAQLATAPKKEPGMTDEEYGRSLHQFYGASYPWGDLPGDVPVRRETIPGSNLTYPGPREVVPNQQ